MPTYTQDEAADTDLELRIGDTWRQDLTLEDEDGTPFDLTGVTGVCRIRSEAHGTILASPTVTITSASTGEWSVELAAATTAALLPGTYRWGVRLTWTTGEAYTVVEGRLVVTAGVV